MCFCIKYLPSPLYFFKLVRNFLCGGKWQISLFWSFLLICILKEGFFHFSSRAFSLAFKFMTEPVNYSVTSTSSGKFWHLSLACLHFFCVFSLLNSVANHQAFEYGIPGSCQNREPYMFPNTTDVSPVTWVCLFNEWMLN